MHSSPTLTAFSGAHYIASGTLRVLAPAIKAVVERDPQSQILIFDDRSGAQIDLNLHGTVEEVLRRLPPEEEEMIPEAPEAAAPRSPGRPKLGVVAREITLLPRHWEWLAGQPGGASVVLRKLVEQAQRDNKDADRQRMARDASYRFMSALAGDLPGFEEASRALFAGKAEQFHACVADWPHDVREYAKKMAAPSFAA